MHTIRVQGVVPPTIDAQIVDAISRAGSAASRGPTAVIGIRNTEGRVYRLVHTAGVAESLALAAGLERLGLVDDPAEFDKARQGCDSIFSVPDWHPSQQDEGY
ncbi:hypothetical protein [Piscinibacter terrae]|uniref:Uncharacterized protein n=1 Tax=Piscinibacter terrae TaxID=2496871 RepID=A0A3N7HMF8_9BURK|nr:hypothetical protein [Albitalea terrae]RQP22246.1 hypothetical protein DZC73_24975 [Albitalea terrae]